MRCALAAVNRDLRIRSDYRTFSLSSADRKTVPSDPEYGKHWFFWALAAILAAATVIFPAQRRAGDWLDDQGNAAPWREAYRLDRFEFGYIPSFGLVTHVGLPQPSGYTS